MSLVLSIDTALGETSLALSEGDKRVAAFHHPARDQQAKMLVPWIEALLREQHIWYPDLEGFVVSIGPGGFTGIRIGLATARALAFAAQKPIAGFSTLEILACHAAAPEVTAVLPAGRGLVFHQQFGASLKPLTEPEMLLLEPSQVRGVLASSDPAQAPQHLVPIKDFAPTLAALIHKEPTRFGEAPVPLYIRPPDAKPQTAFV